MELYFRTRNGIGKTRVLYPLFAVVGFWVGFLPVTASTAEPPGMIRGRIYISPSGGLDSPFVMFGQDVEVDLLRDDGTFDQRLKGLQEVWKVKIKVQTKVVQQAYDRFVSSKPSKEKVERAAILTREQTQLERWKADYRTQVDALIEKYKTASIKADGEGRFAFENLTAGRYLLHASFEVLRTDQWYYWLLPIDLQEGANAEVELKKETSVALYNPD